MFDNIGRKIKGLSNMLFWVGAIASTIIGLVIMGSLANRSRGSEQGAIIFVGILLIAVGIFVSWLSSILLYGYGELIDSNQKILHEMRALKGKTEKTKRVNISEEDDAPRKGTQSADGPKSQKDPVLDDSGEMPNLF